MTIPKMTIIDNKPTLHAKEAVNLLEKLIKGEEVSSMVITPELLTRGSA
jgi:DNA-binding LacI/PurR family transcriptional regulator